MEIGTPDPPPPDPRTLAAPQLTWKSKARGLPTSCSLRMADSPTTVPLKWDWAWEEALGTGSRRGGDTHDTGMVSWAEQAGSISGASLCPVPGTRWGRAHSRRNQI